MMATRENKKGIKEKSAGFFWKDWLDTGAKYLGAIAGLLAIYVAHSFQAALTTTNMINQREEAESSLRATMFNNLIKPLIIDDKNGLSEDNEKLLTELLALNFHENFEFKPLLTHLDERLKSLPPSARESQRKALRSIARRVIQRQEALVTRLEQNGRAKTGLDADDGCVTRIIILRVNPAKLKERSGADSGGMKRCSDIVVVREQYLPIGKKDRKDELVKVQSPDNETFLELVVGEVDWQNQQVRIEVSVRPEARSSSRSGGTLPVELDLDGDKSVHAAIYESIYLNNHQAEQNAALTSEAKNKVSKQFTLTWFDFPLTDYTLLRNGTRFAFFIDSFDDNDFAAIKLLWFPRDFFSPRERPTSYRAYREKPWE